MDNYGVASKMLPPLLLPSYASYLLACVQAACHEDVSCSRIVFRTPAHGGGNATRGDADFRAQSILLPYHRADWGLNNLRMYSDMAGGRGSGVF